MKIFKLMVVALVAMLGFTACDKDCGHEFIEHDFSKDIVGTWTYMESEQCEAMVIKEDGSFNITGVMKGGSLYEEKGTIKVVNNKVTLAYNSGDVFEGRLELVAGKSLSLVMFDDNDIRLTYDYCENDLSDEIVGMWVCTEEVFGQKKSVAIATYNENGKSYFTGFSSEVNGFVKQEEFDYKVVGNLIISSLNSGANTPTLYFPIKFDIIPNGSEFGDIMTTYDLVNGTKPNFLRVKQTLNLTTGKGYYYKSAYVTNSKGKDEDFSILGHTFNMANINDGNFDEIFGADLLCVELNANSIKLTSRLYDQNVVVELPIMVEGNKVILDMSDANPAFRNVDLYMFQDANDNQLHMYMSTNSFINYFANMELLNLLVEGKINPDDSTAIEKFYTDMEARIESINVSFVLKARK